MEKVWLAEYLTCFNATKAAERAGYKWPGRVGWQKKQKFADEISAALEERVMSAEEALAHLSDQARADISPYITDYGIDVEKMKEDGLGHLIKGAKRIVTKFDDRLEVEVYDRQSALKTILTHHTKGPSGSEDDPINVRFIWEEADADD